jgi:hypothetical protein
MGMSNLGFQTVYALINRHPACLCEWVFFPDPSDGALLDEAVFLVALSEANR